VDRRVKPAMPRVTVVGGGIIGASLAYHLAEAGARVTLIEKSLDPPAATAASFAWINASHGNPRPYYDLRLQSMLEWRRLEGVLGDALALKWGGSIEWHATPATLRAAVEEHAAWGYPLRLIDRAAIEDLEPGIASPPGEAAYASLEGSLDPIAATDCLLAAAQERGTRVVPGKEARLHLDRARAAVRILPEEETLSSDVVVLAAGAESQPLAEALGVTLPLANKPGLLIHCRGVAPTLRRLVLSPEAHFKQDPDGHIVAGEDFGGGSPPIDPQTTAKRLLARIKHRLRGGEALRLEAVTLGLRPIPKDGLPVLGFAPEIDNLYLAVMHSGVTLAPIIGRLAAQEIVAEQAAEILDPYRPARFSAIGVRQSPH
jgi:glycine/D-amino acid oxidase-like deaminating enzyme